jgi:hypothetical protein
MFNQNMFIASTFDAVTFIGSPDVGGTVNVSTTWLVSGSPFASQSLDYIVRGSENEILSYGTATTDGSGALLTPVPATYSGDKVMVHVENVGSSMDTTGKFHGVQVVTV